MQEFNKTHFYKKFLLNDGVLEIECYPSEVFIYVELGFIYSGRIT